MKIVSINGLEEWAEYKVSRFVHGMKDRRACCCSAMEYSLNEKVKTWQRELNAGSVRLYTSVRGMKRQIII